jgi:hypothetical protein
MPIYAQSSTLRNLIIPLVDIDFGSLSQDDILQYNATTGKFQNASLSSQGSTLVISASNVGAGEEVFKQKSLSDLEFRTLTSGSGIAVNTVGDEIVISASGANATGENIGTGIGIFESKVVDNIRLRTIQPGSTSQHLAIALSASGEEVEITNSAEINTASSVGTGTSIVAGKVSEDLQFKSIVAGSNVTITTTADEVTINAAGSLETSTKYQFTVSFDGSGNVNSISDVPAGWSITRIGNKITVVHTTGEIVKIVNYLGRDAVNGWQMRFPTSGFQVTVPAGSETTTFVIDLNASVAGADASSLAKVNVIF